MHEKKRSFRLTFAVMLTLLAMTGLHQITKSTRDLPYTGVSDEPHFILPAMSIAVNNDLNPGFFDHPGSTVIYPLAVIYKVWLFGIDNDVGSAALTPESRAIAVATAHQGSVIQIGRILSVAYLLLSVVFLYLLGLSALKCRMTALAATLVFAVLLAKASHWTTLVRTDSASLFFAIAALFAVNHIKSLSSVSRSRLLMAGAAVGLAISTKYYLAVLAIPLVAHVALLRGSVKQTVQAVSVAAAAALFSFAVTSPYVFFALDDVYNYLNSSAQGNFGMPGVEGFSFFENLRFYLLGNSLLPGPLWLIVALGLAVAGRKKFQFVVVHTIWIVAFLVTLASASVQQERWLIPLIPSVALASGILMREVVVRLMNHRVHAFGLAIAAAVVSLTFFDLDKVTARVKERLSKIEGSEGVASGRIEASRWMAHNLPDGFTLATDAAATTFGFFPLMESPEFSVRFQSGKKASVFFRFLLEDLSISDLQALGIQYVAVSNYVESIMQRDQRFYSRMQLHRELAKLQPLKVFSNSIRLYKIDTRARTVVARNLDSYSQELY